MWEIIVLGEIPGSNIQVNFWTWLAIVPPALLFATLLWRVRKQKSLNFWLIVANLYLHERLTRHRQSA
jgi:hypothetical protein